MTAAGVFNIPLGEGELLVPETGKKMFYRFTNTGEKPFNVNGKKVRVGCSIDIVADSFRVTGDQSLAGQPRYVQGNYDLITFL